MHKARKLGSAVLDRPALVVGAIILLTWGLAAWFTTQMVQFEADEIGYTRLAIELGDMMRPFDNGPLGHDRLNQLYPLVIAPFYKAFGNQTAFVLAHLFNPLIFASSAIPAYLVARRVLGGHRGWSYLFALLVATTPWLTMSAVQLTEVVAFPASVWALWGMQRALDEPSPWRDVIALALIGVATFGRLQLIVLAPVFVAAVVLHEVLFDRRQAWRRLRRDHWPIIAALAFGIFVVLPLFVTGLLADIFGYYGNTLSTNRSPLPHGTWDLARTNFVFMAFGLAFVPAAAAIGLVVDQITRGRDRAVHAYAILMGLTVAVLIVQVSSINVTFNYFTVQERYTMFVAPPLLLGGLALLLRGSRPAPMLLVGAVPLAVLMATTSYDTARNAFWYLVSPGLTTYYDIVAPRLNGIAGSAASSKALALGILLALACVAVAVGLGFGRATDERRRTRVTGVLGAALVVFTLGVTVHAFDRMLNGGGDGPGFGDGTRTNADWIDKALPDGQKATLLASQNGQGPDARMFWWALEFWNRGVPRAYRLGDTSYTYASTERAQIDRSDGRVLDDTGPYVVTANTGYPLGVDAPAIARSSDGGAELFRVGSGGARARWLMTGASDDGWLPRRGHTTLQAFGLRDGQCRRLVVSLDLPTSVPAPRTVVASGDGSRRRVVLQPGEPGALDLRLCAAKGRSTAQQRIVLQDPASDPGSTITPRVTSIRAVA